MKWSEQKMNNYHELQWVSEGGLIGLLEECCGKGESLLELGCGTAALIDRLSRNFERSVGVEPSAELLEKAPKRDGIEYRAIPLEEINDSNAFDTVIIRNTLQHVRDPEHAVQVAHKALRPGGRLVVCQGVPPSSRVWNFYEDLFKLFDSRTILSEGDLLMLFRVNGFEKIQLIPYFMEKIDLLDWLRKVSADEQIFQEALKLHQEGDEHFRKAYEVNSNNGNFFMTWRFVVIMGIKSE